MTTMLERSQNASGIRLLQHPFNPLSLALYASLGFEVKEPIMFVTGQTRSHVSNGYVVRRMETGDVEACADLCERVHGFSRTNELHDALQMFKPFVTLRSDRIVAYASAADVWDRRLRVTWRSRHRCRFRHR